MNYELDNECGNIVNIKVVGIGGGGNNAIDRMIRNDVKGVEFVAINTDKQVINYSSADIRIQVGVKLTKGQGAGSNPEIGRKAAEESRDEIVKALEGTDMVFIAAGMGGGTGTGGAAVVAEIAKSMGILTVGVVTKPFSFERAHRMNQAMKGIEELKKNVDSLIVIPNDKLGSVSEEKITLRNAFEIADSILIKAVVSITDLITQTGFLNVDFADIKTVILGAGIAHMGIGVGKTAMEAAKNVVQSPLLETSIEGASKLILNFTSSGDTPFDEVTEAADYITNQGKSDAHVIFGADMRDDIENQVQVIVIATGFDDDKELNKEEVVVEVAKQTQQQTQSQGQAPVITAGETVQSVSTPTAESNRDRDEFDDIQDLFNKKKFF